jgi:hypothetical protein
MNSDTRFIEMEDAALTDALVRILDTFGGGDNSTFIKFINFVRDAEQLSKKGTNMQATTFIMSMKSIGRILKALGKEQHHV